MPDNPITRRLITVPAVFVVFLLLTFLAPLLVPLALMVDIARSVGGKPWMTSRILGFAWFYLLGQIWALAGLAVTVPLPLAAKQSATFWLQNKWTTWNFAGLRTLFSLDLEVEGQESAAESPIVLLVRHASMVDTMLPSRLIANPYGIRLRYVLKRELLVDPTLDIGGHRLPNYFLDRKADDKNAEVAALKDLASTMGPGDGILIYPEGTRYSEKKRIRYVEKASREEGIVGSLAAGLKRTLPPRPGGTLAILDSTKADIVVLAHRGLEGLATARDIWSGGMVGSRIDVKMWRIGRSEVPDSRKERVEWLFRVWSEVDHWVAAPATA